MGLRDKLRRLERATERETFPIYLEDGSVHRFSEPEFLACFAHEFARCHRAWYGEEPGPSHPIIEALRYVSEDGLQRVIREQGTMLGHHFGEDERLRNGKLDPILDLSEP